MKINVFVIYGGKSVEHEVSLKSAQFIINSIDKDKYNVYPVYITKDGKWCSSDIITELIEKDSQLVYVSKEPTYTSIGKFLTNVLKEDEKNIVFPALHGTYGEDGTIQGFLEMLDIPYVGNGVEASAVGIDKCMMRDLFKGNDIPQPIYFSLNSFEWKSNEAYSFESIMNYIGLPCYVKPARLGSSVGISRCETEEGLKVAIKEAFRFDNKIIVEEEIIATEMQVLVVGNESPVASYVGEISQNDPFLDYEIKYTDGRLSHIIPARVDESISKELRELSLKLFKMINGSGLLRVDFFITKDNTIYLNEVNTMPGFTKVSMAPDLWRATNNTKCTEFVEKLISLGFDRFEDKKSTQFSRR